MKNKSYLFLSNVLYIIVFVFIIYLTLITSKFNVIAFDDMHQICYDVYLSLFDNFIGFVYHGRYISNILVKLQCGFFDIHPIIWARTYGAIIKGMFLYLVLYLLTSTIFMFYNKKTFLEKISQIILILICYFLYYFEVINDSSTIQYTAFYGFVFPFIFFIFFWNKFIFLYINNISPSRKEKLALLLLAFSLGISTEFTIFTSFVSLFILLIYNLINKNIKNINLFKYTIPFFISVPFYVFNPGFIFKAQQKGTLNGFSNMLELVKNNFQEYLIASKTTVLNEFLIFLIPIILLFLIITFISKNLYKKNFLLLINSLFISTCLFYFLLIFAGRTPVNDLYASHLDTNLQVKIAFLYIIFLLVSFLLERKIILISFISIFICISSFYPAKIFEKIKYIYIKNSTGFSSKELSNMRYINELFLLHYLSKGLKPVLFEYVACDDFSESYLKHTYNIEIWGLEYDITKTFDEAYALYLKNGGKKLEKFEFNNEDFQKLKEKYSQ